MKFTTFAAMAGLAVFAAPAMAQDVPAAGNFKTGQQLYDECKASGPQAVARCEWYLMGAFDMVGYYQDLDMAKKGICAPVGLTAGIVRDVWLAYMDGARERRLKVSVVSTLYNALQARYPCKAG